MPLEASRGVAASKAYRDGKMDQIFNILVVYNFGDLLKVYVKNLADFASFGLNRLTYFWTVNHFCNRADKFLFWFQFL